VRDWTRINANYFRAIRIEKTMMALILLLIVAVAAFNIVAMLVMVVTDKRTDIAILRTLGARRARHGRVHDAGPGHRLGRRAARRRARRAARGTSEHRAVARALFGFRVMNPDVYYITRIPSELQLGERRWIGGAALR
jgi:lipoprotein-releasing system permease protein